MGLQDEAPLYLRDNITKDEAYYILTTDKETLAILIADKKDTIGKDDMLFLFRVSNEARGWCGSYTNYGKRIDWFDSGI